MDFWEYQQYENSEENYKTYKEQKVLEFRTAKQYPFEETKIENPIHYK